MSDTITANRVYTGTNVFQGPITIPSNAGLQATSMQHRHQITQWLCDHATNFAATRRSLHKVYGTTGTLLKFSAWCTVLAGATTTVTIDLLKNGSTVLSVTITLDSGNTIYVSEDATFSSTTLAAGDLLEVNATVSGTNYPKGVGVMLALNEDPS